MNLKMICIAAASAATLSMAVIPAEAAGVGERRAAEAAAQGPEALRRFIQRTRMIYGLDYQAFRKP